MEFVLRYVYLMFWFESHDEIPVAGLDMFKVEAFESDKSKLTDKIAIQNLFIITNGSDPF